MLVSPAPAATGTSLPPFIADCTGDFPVLSAVSWLSASWRYS